MFLRLVLFLYLSFNGLAHPVSNNRTGNQWNFQRGGLYEGDIMVPNGRDPFERNAVTDKQARWPEGKVYYMLDKSYNEDDRELILAAMEEIEDNSCIRFIETTDHDSSCIMIINREGCWSSLGYSVEPQPVSLESPFCMIKGVIMHELMHALGFLHEQSRADRDDYVTIHWNNIVSGMEPNFAKMKPTIIDHLELDYDLRSVMHYHAWAFAIDRSLPTLSPKDPSYKLQDLGYGQSAGVLTELDSKKLNTFYECPVKKSLSRSKGSSKSKTRRIHHPSNL